MCDFCDLNDNNRDFDIEQRTAGGDVEIVASINRASSLSWINIEAYVDTGVLGGLNIEGCFDINYCPICGRSLKNNV
jgi:hypothetical protein